ncbi:MULTISPECIES: BolA family protein [Idiomarina]|jgi:acid stress-induced BolA-like protein IbaG/YrbA|uniref:BolA family transcriptional regulator n=2 Tax=Idiomarina baltica TaxID=190892 RepID=A0A348WNH7_9GAMM|nr:MULTISPECIES: BolA family protein [Idiomarina]MBL74185.1 BolA family transcriptional regulator [Idiomarinaceae bacterium]MEC8925350.1 BolA family protein [Pseudomonadota bacterium]HAE89941.1 BolA family transcriptional regulator [Idiomarina sp.]EAQ31088.1 putative transcriptional regulator, BolA superfamily protein [Idiomarina baltica OS145]KXS36558.1 MAG: BolA family transcriptional regulator [Idiomarina sp. T82-3]|tara:strand:- start:2408 stop:2662 length:255 start_codon:yes stop_codon:yes gene_type:complete
MNAEQLTALLKNELEIDEAHVKLDGANVNIIAVGEIFASLNRVKSQQMVYQPLKPLIADGTLHAVSIKTYTPETWERDKKLMMP